MLGAGAWPHRVAAQTSPRPGVPFGVQTGEVTADRGDRVERDRPARPGCSSSTPTTERVRRTPRRVVGPAALPETGYTARVVLDRAAGRPGRLLPRDVPGPRRPEDDRARPSAGRFRTAPGGRPRRHASCGRATPPGRAGASTPSGAACASTRRCAASSRTSSCTAAT